MIAPHQNLQFYLTEPIGGGATAILTSIEADTQDGYLKLAEKIRAIGISHWQEFLEKGQVQTSDIPAFWVATPTSDSVIHRDYK